MRMDFSLSGNMICLLASKIPAAIGKSKLGPDFGKSAGARLTVILWVWKEKPEFRTAERTRSRDSWTAVSPSPTMKNCDLPESRSASTSMISHSSPMVVAEKILAGKD